MGRYASASNVFAQMAQNNQNPYKEEAEWMTLIAKLALQKKPDAVFHKQLNLIVKDAGHTYNPLAVKLQGELALFE